MANFAVKLTVAVVSFYISTSVIFSSNAYQLAHISFALSYAFFASSYLARLYWAYESGQKLISALQESKTVLQDTCHKK
jgi:hypothetical protein